MPVMNRSVEVMSGRPRANTMPTELLRKLQQGRVMHHLDVSRTASSSSSSTPVSSPIGSPRFIASPAHSPNTLARGLPTIRNKQLVIRGSSGSLHRNKMTKSSSVSSDSDGSSGDLCNSSQTLSDENGKSKRYLTVPNKSVSRVREGDDPGLGGSLQDLSCSPTDKYIDMCIQEFSDECLQMTRRYPLPKGSEAFEEVKNQLEPSPPVTPRDTSNPNCRTRSKSVKVSRPKKPVIRTSSDPNKANKRVHFVDCNHVLVNKG